MSLRILAAELGILDEYVDQTGRERRVTSDGTRVALLAAMGIDASSDAAAARALDERRERAAAVAGGLAPVRVLPAGSELAPGVQSATAPRGDDGGPSGADGGEITLENGEPYAAGTPLPLGYHLVRRGDEEQMLIVVPPRCHLPARRTMGLTAHLYALRTERDWGVGNLSDLGDLLEWTASLGGAFVGVNPLHALRNRRPDISPYAPVSRLFRNSIYLDIERIPELAVSADARAILDRASTRAELEALRRSERVDYDRLTALEEPLLEALYRAFAREHRDRAGDARGAAYAEFVARGGSSLTDFATFRALEEHFAGEGGASAAGAGAAEGSPSAWRSWPAAYRSPESPEVRAFRESHREAVDRHRWVQFELDRQLGEAAERGRRAGLTIGVYQDLAIGSAPDGSDVWAFPGLFASGVALGAPPDAYAPEGQNWGLPPLDPHRLAADRYRYWIALVRAGLRHAGALRIDHVLGLFRQFWIPDGSTGRDGAYVRFPTDDLFGILALESVRHGAVIVGEDLGTVPPEVPGTLERWGVLASRVLHFERDPDGAFRPSGAYPELSLATANTHDMAPLAGFWSARDIAVRAEVGLLAPDVVEGARRERDAERRALVERLSAEGTLEVSDGADDPRDQSVDAPADLAGGGALRAAVHRFLCRTPALMVGIALDDLAGEVEPLNVPGVGIDAYPSWTRRMRVSLEAMRRDPAIRAELDCRERAQGGAVEHPVRADPIRGES